MIALPWNSGIDAVEDVVGADVERHRRRRRDPGQPALGCIRTALGAPVEPDVNSSRSSSTRRPAGDVSAGGVVVDADAVPSGSSTDRIRRAARRGRARRAAAPCPVGDDQLAVGVADVASQLGAAPRRVDADDRRARERGAAEPEQVLGHVLEQHADVERAGGSPSQCHRGPHPTGAHDLGPGVGVVLEAQTDARVVGARREQVGDGRHRPGSSR